VTGSVAAQAGQRCALRLIPNESPRLTCRANLECGGRVIYGEGTTGYLECSFADGVPVSAIDAEADDGDPAFDMNLQGNRLIVSSDLPDAEYRVTVLLDPPGRLATADGASGTPAGGATTAPTR
jgi:hypothetical protein